jgi:hypothetical protein
VSTRPLPLPVNPALLQHTQERRQSLENRLADQITRFARVNAVRLPPRHLVAAWIGFGIEPYPFGLLTMILSLEAIFLSTFVMISQTAPARSGRCWPTTSGRWSRRRISKRGVAPLVQPDSGAHQGDPRGDRRTGPCRPDPTGRHLTSLRGVVHVSLGGPACDR